MPSVIELQLMNMVCGHETQVMAKAQQLEKCALSMQALVPFSTMYSTIMVVSEFTQNRDRNLNFGSNKGPARSPTKTINILETLSAMKMATFPTCQLAAASSQMARTMARPVSLTTTLTTTICSSGAMPWGIFPSEG